MKDNNGYKKKAYSYSKKLKIELFVILAFGIFFIALGLGLLFGLYRPFVPWQKFNCTFEAGTLEFVEGAFNCLYRYKINGVGYEVIVKNYAVGPAGGGALRHVENIYVNKNNPYDVKVGTYGTDFLIALLIFIIAGIGAVVFAFYNYYSKQKKRKRRRK